MNEPRSLHHSQSKIVCQDVLQIMVAKTPKNPYRSDGDVQTFLKRKENQKMERKTESYVFSGFDNGISRS